MHQLKDKETHSEAHCLVSGLPAVKNAVLGWCQGLEPIPTEGKKQDLLIITDGAG